MKVILLQDVAKLGKKFEIKEVSNGYALNFLFPQKKAEMATAQSIKEIEKQKELHLASLKEKEIKIKETLDKIKDLNIIIKAPANEEGKLFAGIGAKEIVKAIKEQAQVEIDPKLIILENPLKEIGEHIIKTENDGEAGEVKITIEQE